MLVRYFTGLPPEMADISASIIESDDDLLVTDVALAETAHVLRTVYRKPREDIIDRFLDFVERPNISFFGVDTRRVQEALFFCRPSNRVSIPDALIWAVARGAGDATILTFDERFLSDGVSIRQPR